MAFETHNCKTPDCEGQTMVTRGRHAYLCSDCISGRKPLAAQLREQTQGSVAARPLASPTQVMIGQVSYEKKARELVPRGKVLDKTLRKVAAHKRRGEEMQSKHRRAGEGIQRDLTAAIRGWNEALDGLRMGQS